MNAKIRFYKLISWLVIILMVFGIVLGTFDNNVQAFTGTYIYINSNYIDFGTLPIKFTQKQAQENAKYRTLTNTGTTDIKFDVSSLTDPFIRYWTDPNLVLKPGDSVELGFLLDFTNYDATVPGKHTGYYKVTATNVADPSDTMTLKITATVELEDLVCHKVKFNPNGGSSVSVQSVADGHCATMPSNPTKTGFLFYGWYTDSACTQKYDFSTPVNSDITLNAKWILPGSIKTSISVDETSYDFGYVPLGFSEEVIDATQKTITVTNTGTTDVKICLEGLYDNPFGTIWYDSNYVLAPGKSMSIQLVLSKFEQTSSVLGSHVSTIKVVATNAETTADTTSVDITAKVDIYKYLITFDANGGTGTMPNMYIGEDNKLILPECKFNPPSSNGEFKGWSIDNKTYEPGDEISISKDTVVKPVWSYSYTISYVMNGHGSDIKSQTVLSGEKASKPADPSASGFAFGGWYTDSALTAAYDFNSEVSADVTLYAKWTSTTTPGSSTPTPATPTPATPNSTTPASPTPSATKPASALETDEKSFEDFVERLYTVALGRDSEPEGKEFWCEHVGNGDLNGAQCANEFLLSKEFKDRGLNDEKFLEVLYKTFFDREAKDDKDGFNFWMNCLKTQGRDSVVDCFINSEEWCNVCASFGVKSGATRAKATIASKNATAFATRLYTECLGRDAEEGGLKFWALGLTNLELTGKQAAHEFFFSKEFNDFGLDNEGLLTRMYKTFMGREPDTDGMNYWLGEMNGGMTKEQVFECFVNSAEFTQICKDYAIDRG